MLHTLLSSPEHLEIQDSDFLQDTEFDATCYLIICSINDKIFLLLLSKHSPFVLQPRISRKVNRGAV